MSKIKKIKKIFTFLLKFMKKLQKYYFIYDYQGNYKK